MKLIMDKSIKHTFMYGPSLGEVLAANCSLKKM